MANTPEQVSSALAFLLDMRTFSQQIERSAAGFLPTDEEKFLDFCFRHCHGSTSQLFQEMFVAWHLGEKRHGYFVEFGATNGIDLSNTWLLENKYQWHGILAEPARIWHEPLRRNRACIVDRRCVWEKSGAEIMFNETSSPELSTVDAFSASDNHARFREDGNRYAVSTISLSDLLAEHGAPNEIDYLSIDTEGSELNILRAFDFARYRIGLITVEHNFTPAREQIHALLASKGYVRKFEAFSKWDDWYVKV